MDTRVRNPYLPRGVEIMSEGTRRDRRLSKLLGVTLPIVQAPMAGVQDQELAIAVAEAGGLGSLPCAMLTPEGVRRQVGIFRQRTSKPVNLNFFCHAMTAPDPEREAHWRALLERYYAELGIDPSTSPRGPSRAPFEDSVCAVVETLSPEVVSFHFGLPPRALLERVRATGAKILSSATTVAEARRLEDEGCDAIIAQGAEAGGHRGMFLTRDVSAQVGTFALVPQVVDAVKVPVIASGGIADARGVAAALALGAAGVQIGTAYLRCPEATTSALHRAALAAARDDATRIANVYTGRPARGLENRFMRELGPLNEAVPPFPAAAGALAPLRAEAEARGSTDFSTLWAGQAAPLAREVGAGDLTRQLARDAARLLGELAQEGPLAVD
jgi:nitronate monooxygenase